MLDIGQIQNILPQRYPFLMIDRIVELIPRKKAVALKNVSINEQFFTGHFPGNPVMPGVLIIEAMAQSSIVLLFGGEEGSAAQNKGLTYYLGSVKARFLHPVFAGDQLKITVEPVKIVSSSAIIKAVAEVADKEAARAEIGLIIKNG